MDNYMFTCITTTTYQIMHIHLILLQSKIQKIPPSKKEKKEKKQTESNILKKD